MAKKFYVPVNGSSKEVKKFYAPVNGISKKVVKAYCSENGLSKCFYGNSFEKRVYKLRVQRLNYGTTIGNITVKEFIGDSSITRVTGKVIERSNAPQGETIRFTNAGVEPLTPLTPYGTEVELPNYDYTKGIELRVESPFWSQGSISTTVYAVIELTLWR